MRILPGATDGMRFRVPDFIKIHDLPDILLCFLFLRGARIPRKADTSQTN